MFATAAWPAMRSSRSSASPTVRSQLVCLVAATCAIGFTAGAGQVAGGSCLDQVFPPLPTCFDSQPTAGSGSCYEAGSYGNASNPVEAVTCRYNPRSANFSDADYVLMCSGGVWQTAHPGRALPACVAEPNSAWRVVNYAATSRGWWIHELKLYSDHTCRHEISDRSGQVGLRFGSGPTGTSPDDELADGFDGNVNSFWRAPCIASDSHDLCGCKTYMGEGWSNELKQCKQGVTTNGHGEKYCAEKIAAGQKEPIDMGEHGCPAGLASIGVHLVTPIEVRCIRFMQFGTPAYASKAMALEAWNGGAWTKVRTWTGLRSGIWETLRVREGCAPFEIPGSSWVEVNGHNGDAAHGEKRNISCMGGAQMVEVVCSDGRWSDTGTLNCLEPSTPAFASWIHTAGPEPERGPHPVMAASLSLGGMVISVVVVIGVLHLVRWWMRRRAWNRLVMYGAPPPGLEEQERLTRQVAMAMPPREPPPLLAALPQKSRRTKQGLPPPPAGQPESAARQAALSTAAKGKEPCPPQPIAFLPPDLAKIKGSVSRQDQGLNGKTNGSAHGSADKNVQISGSVTNSGDATVQISGSLPEVSATNGAFGRAGPVSGVSWRAAQQSQKDALLPERKRSATTSANAVKEAIKSSPSPAVARGTGQSGQSHEKAGESSSFWKPPVIFGKSWSKANDGGGNSEDLHV